MLRRPCFSFLLLCACSGPDASTFKSVHPIDATTEIVENDAPLWSAEERWVLQQPHLFEIAGSLVDAENDLIAVKAIDRLSDGRWVIADAGDYRLKFYGSDGTHLYDAGGKGDGPGEFRFIDDMTVLPGDTVVVIDAAPFQWSRSWFDTSGRFIRSEPLKYLLNSYAGNTNPTYSNGFHFIVGGSVVVQILDLNPRPESGVEAPEEGYALLRADGSLDTIGWFPSMQIQRRKGQPAQVLLFSSFNITSAGPRSMFIGSNATYEVGQYNGEGKLERVIRRSIQPRPVTRKVLRQYKELVLDQVRRDEPDKVEEYEASLRNAPTARHIPLYMELHADSEGRLWVRNMTPNDSIWSVFEHDGRYLGDVVIPRTESVLAVHDEYLVTRADPRESLGIPRLRFYRLLRPGVASSVAESVSVGVGVDGHRSVNRKQ